MLKVLFLAPNIKYEGHSGGSKHLREITKELSKLASINLVCRSERPFRRGNLKIFNTNSGRFSIFSFPKILKLAKSSDIIHTRIDPFELSGLISARMLKKPIMGEVNINFLSYERKGNIRDLFYPPFNAIKLLWVKIVLSQLDAVVCVSETIKKSLEKHGIRKDKIFVVRNGGNVKEFRQRNKKMLRSSLGLPNGILVIHMGELGPRHGIESLLKINLPNVFFLIVGGSEKYKSYIKKLKNSAGKNFIFAGPLTPEKLRDYIEASDIAIAPYKESDNKEPFGYCPVKILDFMAAGLPVVASDRPWIREIISKGEGIITNDFESAIKRLKNEKLRKRLGKAGKEKIKKRLAWSNSAKSLVNIYSSVI